MLPLARITIILGGDSDNELALPEANATIATLTVRAWLIAWGPGGPITLARHGAVLLIAALNLFLTIPPLNLLIANVVEALRTTALGGLNDVKASRPGSITA